MTTTQAPLAIVSVSDKSGDLIQLVKCLQSACNPHLQLVSTGGTYKYLAESGIPNLRDIASITGMPELLGGRVKTLHPAVHAGILARSDVPTDLADLAQHGIGLIAVVVCNLYPFGEWVAKNGGSSKGKADDGKLREALEMIDIGGVTLLRAAAKNFPHVAVLTDPADYGWFMQEVGAFSIGARLNFIRLSQCLYFRVGTRVGG